MNEFLKVFLSLSLSGALLILALLLCKLIYKNKLSRQWQYYIWLVVIVRLLLPFASEANLMDSIFQKVSDVNIQADINPQFERNGSVLPEADITQDDMPTGVGEGLIGGKQQEPEKQTVQNVIRTVLQNIWVAWLMGVIVLLIRKVTVYQSFINYIKAGRVEVSDIEIWERLGKLVEQTGVKRPVEIYTNSLISSPLLIGFFRPCIMLPSMEISDSDFQYTILHELTHYKRMDMFYKWLAQVVICLHWFNPFVYLMGREINRACELSCDEAVIQKLDAGAQRTYGDTLLNALGAGGSYKSSLASVTLSESKELLKERLDMIMNYKKKSIFILFTTALLTILLLCGATVTGAYAATTNVPMVSSTAINSSTSHEKEVFNLTDRFNFAGGYHSNTTFTLENDATIQISTNITTTAGQLNFAIQPIRDGDYYRNNLLIDKNGNAIKKLYEASGSNVRETQTISLEAGTYWASLTGAGTIQNANWKITGTIVTDKPLDSLHSGRVESLSQNFQKYKPFGVIYNAEQDALFYNSERVKRSCP